MSNKNATTSLKINKDSIPTTNGRLSSFGMPRDLTLGGLGGLRGAKANANKKIYSPNLNVIRNKNTNVKTSKDTTRVTKRTDNTKSNRGGGRNRDGGNLFQTSSIFSEGIAGSLVKRNSESFSRRDESAPLRKPTITKNSAKVDSAAEKLNIKELLGDSDDNDGFDEKIDTKYMPVKFNKESDILVRNIDGIDLIERRNVVKEFFETNGEKLFLVQIPDTMPCDIDDNLDDKTMKSNESKQSGIKLEEGQNGKLVRYKSGKCKLILGKTPFNINIGLETGFLQELTVINTNSEERNGNIINLGLINCKMIVSPDWKHLLGKNS